MKANASTFASQRFPCKYLDEGDLSESGSSDWAGFGRGSQSPQPFWRVLHFKISTTIPSSLRVQSVCPLLHGSLGGNTADGGRGARDSRTLGSALGRMHPHHWHESGRVARFTRTPPHAPPHLHHPNRLGISIPNLSRRRYSIESLLPRAIATDSYRSSRDEAGLSSGHFFIL